MPGAFFADSPRTGDGHYAIVPISPPLDSRFGLARHVCFGQSQSPRCGLAQEAATHRPEQLAKLAAKPSEEKKKFPDWDKLVEGIERLEGLFPLYYDEKEQKLFMEVKQEQYDKELILPIAIARERAARFSAATR